MSSNVDILVLSSYADNMLRVGTVSELGAAIRERRKERGMSQAELAHAAGLSRQWVSEIENGKSTAEIGAVLRAVSALGLMLGTTEIPAMTVSIDDIIDNHTQSP